MKEPFRVIPALAAQDMPAVAILVERCVCCWPLAHPGQAYPASWSSTLCADHRAWYRQHRAWKRAGHA